MATQVQVQPQQPLSAPNGSAVAAAAAAAAAAGNTGGGGSQFVTTSLYVGDLELNVTDSQLYDLFSQLGQVVSVRVCRDVNTRISLGYAYVNYSNTAEAARALDVLNFTPINGKPIRIMYSYRDPSIRRSGTANIFIKNLDKAIDNKALHETFSTFGNILSCKIATDPSGQSKGYGFVQYDNEESAQRAIDQLNGMLLNDKPVFVGPFLRRQERDSATNKVKFNNVFVKNLSESTTQDDLEKIFAEYGNVTSVAVKSDDDGKSRCFGFVNFENPDDAAKAVEALNGKKFDDKEWYVGKAQKKFEREIELKERFQSMKEAVDKVQGLNLYVKNLDDSIDDDKLREMFSEFGTITSCKVMQDPSGISRGSGFVAFSTSEEASRALGEMNGKMVVSKPLYVAVAQRKEDRKARLQAQFSQMRPVAMAPSIGPRMPMYPPGGPGLGQQIFYGQGPPAIIPPQEHKTRQWRVLPMPCELLSWHITKLHQSKTSE
ncbi:Polyadenylate-binding protein [Thalictrum thalictroides]|uniref:Polyadenylate-binding protein n=1 Tax=Thalictrum thalictroides TaxID=46969 RepID=A0A7J6VW12_THATH|nr:Polyadenylate-binding protein [Thalictrum thalictroides]